jgi:hypothetical protein
MRRPYLIDSLRPNVAKVILLKVQQPRLRVLHLHKRQLLISDIFRGTNRLPCLGTYQAFDFLTQPKATFLQFSPFEIQFPELFPITILQKANLQIILLHIPSIIPPKIPTDHPVPPKHLLLPPFPSYLLQELITPTNTALPTHCTHTNIMMQIHC